MSFTVLVLTNVRVTVGIGIAALAVWLIIHKRTDVLIAIFLGVDTLPILFVINPIPDVSTAITICIGALTAESIGFKLTHIAVPIGKSISALASP